MGIENQPFRMKEKRLSRTIDGYRGRRYVVENKETKKRPLQKDVRTFIGNFPNLLYPFFKILARHQAKKELKKRNSEPAKGLTHQINRE